MQHGDSLRQKQRRQKIAHLPFAQNDDGGVVRGSFDSAIPTQLIAVTIGVVFEIRFVVPLAIGHQVVQGHAVVCGHKIDAGSGLASVVPEQIAGSGQPLREFPHLPGVAAPERARGVSIAVVPLCPPCGKAAELVAAQTHIPGLGDQFHVGQCGFGAQRLEQRRLCAESAGIAAQHRCQIEAKAIDVHLLDPVPQAIDDERAYPRMFAVDGVAAAGEILVKAQVCRG